MKPGYIIIAVLGATILSTSLLLALAFSSVAASTENRSSTDFERQGQTEPEQKTDTTTRTETETETPTSTSEQTTRNNQPPMIARNHPPLADAGSNQIVKDSDEVTLDGSRSIDPDGDKLSYNWQLVSPKNLQVSLEDVDSEKAHFTAPSLDETNRINLIFKLDVSDGNLQDSATVRVVVTPKSTESGNTKTITVIDTGEQASENQFFASDVCGAGTYAYSYLASGVKWRTFPVTFAIDATNSHMDINTAKAAVRKAFAAIDALNQPAGVFFQETSNYAAAKIKFTWKYIDGPYKQLGYTSFSYRTDTRAMTSATVTLDSGDRYFVSATDRCGSFGSLFDLQNIATHEIGHAINLGHVSDRLQSMYPTSYAGETLKRSLGNGDKLGITNLY
jgi:hypothetical protein